jgi:hypothetical protein
MVTDTWREAISLCRVAMFCDISPTTVSSVSMELLGLRHNARLWKEDNSLTVSGRIRWHKYSFATTISWFAAMD